MGQRRTAPVVQHTIVDATPAGSVRRRARIEESDVHMDYESMIPGWVAIDNPRGRARLTHEDLAALRRQQRENYDMYTEDARAQQRTAEARGVIREQRGILRGGWMGEEAMDYNYSAQEEAQRTLDTFRETGVNADRRATEREIAEANAAGRRRREEVEQGRMVRARVEGSVMGAVRR